jgi:hypothetical protein
LKIIILTAERLVPQGGRLGPKQSPIKRLTVFVQVKLDAWSEHEGCWTDATSKIKNCKQWMK